MWTQSMKVANVIIAHTNPEQLFTFVSQYPTELFHSWIHLDKRCNIDDYEALTNLPGVTILQRRKKIVWAGNSFVKMTVQMFREIAKANEKYFYYNLMSGMDFPIQPPRRFYQFLLASYKNQCSEFFQISELDESWPAKTRYEFLHFSDWTMRGRNFAERIINSFIKKRKFYGGKLKPYGRSAWFTATDNFVHYSLDYFEKNPDYLRFLQTVWCPDEFAFSSLIMGSPFKDKIAANHLRYIDWSEGKASPKVLRMEDFSRLAASGLFIARKFDVRTDAAIIKTIEDKLIKE
jgi:hypothetical protein